ncbi:MAG: zeta toxin family protein [Thermodesulfobacteriota bacterium]|nr:zeta toxin family protein [Thermodesulfobacteriota bacterium]
MDKKSTLWLIAGGNGAGKSTFYNKFLANKGIKFVNADIIAKEIDSENSEQKSYEAAMLAESLREEMITEGVSFCYETVFSHESKVDFIAQAKAKGYKVYLIYIHLRDSNLNEGRVKQRITEGGHSVPLEKIHSRIPRTMKNIKVALSLVDEARILDNSLRKDPFKQIIIMKSGDYEAKVDPLPDWAKGFLP